mmetsp:Transcript_27681/g.58488  ORF Transcript_27681/g.58488 Transcript_27681/m.58488 type:complete len:89 (+) Transcript_27681:63-329(+)
MLETIVYQSHNDKIFISILFLLERSQDSSSLNKNHSFCFLVSYWRCGRILIIGTRWSSGLSCSINMIKLFPLLFRAILPWMQFRPMIP